MPSFICKDISIKVYSEDGLLLCSSLQEKSVALLTEEQADTKGIRKCQTIFYLSVHMA
jgi:hypothetical protein